MFSLIHAGREPILLENRAAGTGGVPGVSRAPKQGQPELSFFEITSVGRVVDDGKGPYSSKRCYGEPLLPNGLISIVRKLLGAICDLPQESARFPWSRKGQLQHRVLFLPMDPGFDFHLRTLCGNFVALADRRVSEGEESFDHDPNGAIFDDPHSR